MSALMKRERFRDGGAMLTEDSDAVGAALRSGLDDGATSNLEIGLGRIWRAFRKFEPRVPTIVFQK